MEPFRRCRIALVEHDAAIAGQILATLRTAGHDCRRFASGATALREIAGHQFDCILIERALPDIAPFDLMNGVRARLGYTLPVIGLAGDAEGVVAALDEGADDCLPRPVQPRLLVARVNAAIRRASPDRSRLEASIGHLAFQPEGHRVLVDGRVVQLTAKEYALALMLCRRLGDAIPRDEILGAIWGEGVATATRTLDVHVSRLRSKLELKPQRGFRLAALYGRGYRLDRVADAPPVPLSSRRSASPSAPPAAARPPAAR